MLRADRKDAHPLESSLCEVIRLKEPSLLRLVELENLGEGIGRDVGESKGEGLPVRVIRIRALPADKVINVSVRHSLSLEPAPLQRAQHYSVVGRLIDRG